MNLIIKEYFLQSARLFIELLRWIVVVLFFVLVFRLSKEIIEPLFTDEIKQETAKQLLNLVLFGSILAGIKKLQSFFILFGLVLLLFALILLDKYIIKLTRIIFEYFHVYGEKRI